MTEPDPKGSGFYFDVAELRIYAPNVGRELGIDQMIAALVDTERSAELARRTTNLVKWAARWFFHLVAFPGVLLPHEGAEPCIEVRTEKRQPGTMPLARISAADSGDVRKSTNAFATAACLVSNASAAVN